MQLKTRSAKSSGRSQDGADKPDILNAATPCGLFESSNGNKYIVGDDGECKFAITLQHVSLRAFSWQPLTETPIDKRKWRGRYALRLTHAVRGTDSRKTGKAWSGALADEKPGVVGIGDGVAMLRCRRGQFGKLWMPLGCVTETGFCDYNGWALVAVDNRATFFEKVAPGHRPSELLKVFEDLPELTDRVLTPKNNNQ